MINTTASILSPDQSPEDEKAEIEADLRDAKVGGAEVTLKSVDVDSMVFSIICPDNDKNYAAMVELFGKRNTLRGEPREVRATARGLSKRKEFKIRGSEGQFAKDHRPPEGAK